jgi:peptidoglycan/xylan/chitin deacetylase (PgdA/CDA1 family)
MWARRRRALAGLLSALLTVLIVWAAWPAPHEARHQAARTTGGSTGLLPSAIQSGSAVAPLPRPLARLRPGPAQTLIRGPRALAVPILRYHIIGSPPRHEPYPYLFVARSAFVAQLRYLVRHGYRAVTLQQLYDFWHGRGTLPPHPVVLSFDDGYLSQFSVAAPLLHELRWPGELGLCVRFVMARKALPPPYVRADGPSAQLTLADVRALIAAGWEIDAHTISHPTLTRVSATRLTHEVSGSRTVLHRLLGLPMNFFYYPRGVYDSAVVAAVRRAGYLGAITCRSGLASGNEPYILKRIGVERGESLGAFAASLRPGA